MSLALICSEYYSDEEEEDGGESKEKDLADSENVQIEIQVGDEIRSLVEYLIQSLENSPKDDLSANNQNNETCCDEYKPGAEKVPTIFQQKEDGNENAELREKDDVKFTDYSSTNEIVEGSLSDSDFEEIDFSLEELEGLKAIIEKSNQIPLLNLAPALTECDIREKDIADNSHSKETEDEANLITENNEEININVTETCNSLSTAEISDPPSSPQTTESAAEVKCPPTKPKAFRCPFCELTITDREDFSKHLLGHYNKPSLNNDDDAAQSSDYVETEDIQAFSPSTRTRGKCRRTLAVCIAPSETEMPENINVRKRKRISSTLDQTDKHSKKIPCNVCGKSFSRFYLPVHMRFHNGEKRYGCPSCPTRFVTLSNGRYHMIRVHKSTMDLESLNAELKNKIEPNEQISKAKLEENRKRIYVDDHDAKKMKQNRRRNGRSKAKQRETPKKIACKVCGKFTNVHYMPIHMRSHTGEKPYGCPSCPKSFPRRSFAVTHVRCVHKSKMDTKSIRTLLKQRSTAAAEATPNNPEQKSEILPTKTTDEENAIKLKRRNTRQMRKKPPPQSQRNIHIQLDVNLKEPVKTESSPPPVAAKSSLPVNKKQFHTIKWSKRKEKACPPSQLNLTLCVICKKSFTKVYLPVHMRFHNGERLFKCLSCPKRFFTKNHANEHMKRCEVVAKPSKHQPTKAPFTTKRIDDNGTRKTEIPFEKPSRKKLICEFCNKLVVNWYLPLHIKKRHPNEGTSPQPVKMLRKRKKVLGPIKSRSTSAETAIKATTPLIAPNISDTVVAPAATEKKGKVQTCNKKTNKTDHRTSSQKVSCKICKRFVREHNLPAHMRLHTGEKPFGCRFCIKRFTSKPHENYHVKTAHPNEKYSKHLKPSPEKKKAADARRIKSESKSISAETASNIADVLPAPATAKENEKAVSTKKTKKIELVNANEKLSFQTEKHALVSKKSKSTSQVTNETAVENVVVHALVAAEKKGTVACPICKKIYQRSYINEHTKRVHQRKMTLRTSKDPKDSKSSTANKLEAIKVITQNTQTKPCKVLLERCDDILDKKGAAPLSKKKAKRLPLSKSSSNISKRGKEIAAKKNSKDALNEKKSKVTDSVGQRKTENGKNSFPCFFTGCSQICSTKTVLNAHYRIHTGERPYQCDTCSKRFSFLASLHYHLKIHNNEKPHKCSYCGNHFRSAGNLGYHIRSIHGNVIVPRQKSKKKMQ